MPQQKQPRRIDLSVAQVAAGALAAAAGALLASELGVYGTIAGAAVVSIGATTGGAVLHHLFKRGGEQLRDAVERGRQLPGEPAPDSEWNEPRTLRARGTRTWRTYAALSVLVFALAMTPLVAFELITGRPVAATVQGNPGHGTSFGGSVGRERAPAPARTPADPGSHSPAAQPSPSATPSETPSGTPSPSASATPSPSATPSATPSASPSSTPSATPTPSGTPTPY